MKLFIITTIVEGLKEGVDIKTSLKDAIDFAVKRASGLDGDTDPDKIRAAAQRPWGGSGVGWRHRFHRLRRRIRL